MGFEKWSSRPIKQILRRQKCGLRLRLAPVSNARKISILRYACNHKNHRKVLKHTLKKKKPEDSANNTDALATNPRQRATRQPLPQNVKDALVRLQQLYSSPTKLKKVDLMRFLKDKVDKMPPTSTKLPPLVKLLFDKCFPGETLDLANAVPVPMVANAAPMVANAAPMENDGLPGDEDPDEDPNEDPDEDPELDCQEDLYDDDDHIADAQCGLVALENTSSFSYATASLQVLASSPALLSFFSTAAPASQSLSSQLALVLSQLNTLTGPRCISLRHLQRVFNEVLEVRHNHSDLAILRFNAGAEHDPVQFVSSLIPCVDFDSSQAMHTGGDLASVLCTKVVAHHRFEPSHLSDMFSGWSIEVLPATRLLLEKER
jgi:hypothetical protein